MCSFLEHEQDSIKPKLQLNDITLDKSCNEPGRSDKRISLASNWTASSGYCSGSSDDVVSASEKSFYVNDSIGVADIIDLTELLPKTDLELFRPTQNQAFRQNVLDCDDIHVDDDKVDDLNSTLERVDFILNYVGYEPKKYAENKKRKRLLKEFGKKPTVGADKESRKRALEEFGNKAVGLANEKRQCRLKECAGKAISSVNENRRRILKEVGEKAAGADKRKMIDKRTISVDKLL